MFSRDDCLSEHSPQYLCSDRLQFRQGSNAGKIRLQGTGLAQRGQFPYNDTALFDCNEVVNGCQFHRFPPRAGHESLHDRVH
jgi:hypothetical protein